MQAQHLATSLGTPQHATVPRCCSDNEISKLPAVVTTLTRLTELRAAHNKFASLPSAIGRLREIRYLDLSHNKVCTATPGFAACGLHPVDLSPGTCLGLLSRSRAGHVTELILIAGCPCIPALAVPAHRPSTHPAGEDVCARVLWPAAVAGVLGPERQPPHRPAALHRRVLRAAAPGPQQQQDAQHHQQHRQPRQPAPPQHGGQQAEAPAGGERAVLCRLATVSQHACLCSHPAASTSLCVAA